MHNKFNSNEKFQKALNSAEGTAKQPFVDPKLTFIEPKLVKQGQLENVTAGFAGTFSPLG